MAFEKLKVNHFCGAILTVPPVPPPRRKRKEETTGAPPVASADNGYVVFVVILLTRNLLVAVYRTQVSPPTHMTRLDCTMWLCHLLQIW